jgi:hypothetical protein
MHTVPPISDATLAKLTRIGRGSSNETEDSIRQLFRIKNKPLFEPVVATFLWYGGYCLPFSGNERFKILRAKAAVRDLRFWEPNSCNPTFFRITFGQSETIQCNYLMDGHGHIFEDDVQIAESASDWIEHWAHNYSRSS